MTDLNRQPGATRRLRKPPVCLDQARHPAHGATAAHLTTDQPIDGKAGWSISEWCAAVSLGRSRVYELIADGTLRSVTIGRRRIITTKPTDFLAALAGA